MLKFRVGLAMFCLAVLVLVGVQNSDVVALQFLGWQTEISLLALITVTAAAGLVSGFLLGKATGLRRSGAR